MGLCALAVPRYHTTIPHGDYLLKAGWRQPVLADLDRSHASEPGCKVNDRNCDEVFWHGLMPRYEGPDRWDELRPLLHGNLVLLARLERWVIQHRLDPSFKDSTVASPDLAMISNFIRKYAYIVGLPALLVRPFVWSFWSLLVVGGSVLSPFIVSIVAAPVFAYRMNREARYFPFVGRLWMMLRWIWESLKSMFHAGR
jgi:hypothetical protein